MRSEPAPKNSIGQAEPQRTRCRKLAPASAEIMGRRGFQPIPPSYLIWKGWFTPAGTMPPPPAAPCPGSRLQEITSPFRLEVKKLFLRRPNGRELVTSVVKRIG